MASLPISGKTALVTGASRGIGAATALALDAAGARVALVARSRGDMESVASRMAHSPLVLEADLGDPEAPASVAGVALEAFGGVDILVNNAAVGVRLPTTETTASMIDSMLAVNVRAPILLVGALAQAMISQGGGCIVNVSSVSGLIGTPKRAAYAASKGALDAATRSLAIELGPHGIRVNAVAPGVVDTAMWAANREVPGVIEQIEKLTPLRRWGTSEDIADVIVFLASDAGRFLTGQTISVDGGMAHTLDLFAGPA